MPILQTKDTIISIIIVFDPGFLTFPLFPYHTMQRFAIKAKANFCIVQFAAYWSYAWKPKGYNNTGKKDAKHKYILLGQNI